MHSSSSLEPSLGKQKSVLPMRAIAPIQNDVWQVTQAYLGAKGLIRADSSKPGGCFRCISVDETAVQIKAVLHNATIFPGQDATESIFILSVAEAIQSGGTVPTGRLVFSSFC